MIIWRMRSACWIPKATNAHTGFVILIAFPLQQWLHGVPQYYVIRKLSVFSYSRRTVFRVSHEKDCDERRRNN